MARRFSPPSLPEAPVDLIAVAVSGGEVLLAWNECGTGGLGFRIERSNGNGPACLFSEIGGVGSHVAAFRDGSVKPHTIYSYRVHAWNAYGKSSPSNVIVVTMPPAGTDLPVD
jgi:hypothetical protein